MSGMQQWASPDILALYHLADVNDASGNSHTLTNGGTVTFGPGKFGDCALFGDANSSKYLLHSDNLGKDLSGEASISAWFLIQTLPTSGKKQCIVRWASTLGTARYYVVDYFNDSGTNKLIFYHSNTSYLSYSIDLLTNVWYKLDIVIGATCKLYLNASEILSDARGTAVTSYDAISIGAYYTTSATDYFKGKIDEFIFFNVARTAQQIRRRYAFERGMLM